MIVDFGLRISDCGLRNWELEFGKLLSIEDGVD
jgi:hypothetical protein